MVKTAGKKQLPDNLKRAKDFEKADREKRPRAKHAEGYLSAVEYARLYSMDVHQVRKDLRRGRIEGAQKINGRWRIPFGAIYLHRGLPMRRTSETAQRFYFGISVREFAEKHGRSITTVYGYLYDGRIPGAVYTAHGWDIPADAEWPSGRAGGRPVHYDTGEAS